MALSQLYTDYHQLLYNFCRQFCHDDELIKDCIQDLFLDLWIRRKYITIPDHPKKYLFRSIRNNVVRRLTLKKKRERSYAITSTGDLPFDPVPDMEATHIRAEREVDFASALIAAFEQLTARQKEIVFLRFYENFEYVEISEIMSISKKATYKLLYRALDVLRAHLSPDILNG